MKTSPAVLLRWCIFLCLCASLSGCDLTEGQADDSQGEPRQPRHGVLSFRVSHNVDDAGCLDDGNCFFETNQEQDIEQWLRRVRGDSDLAVLHWNRPIPYHTFSVDLPEGTSRIDFYEERLSSSLVDWLEAFATHFEQMPRGYLAVSALNSRRTRPGPSFTGETDGAPVTDATCPDVSPGSEFEVTGPDGTQKRVEFEHAYTNFLLYLYEKLSPEAFGLVVEANLFGKHCPNRWPGFVDLYHSIYDTVRAEVGPAPRLFATVTYLDLLNYDLERCTGGPQVESCDGPVGDPSYGSLDPEQCYQIDLSPVKALDEGGRMDLLALSAYPDGLLMSVPGGPDAVEFHPPSSNGSEDCQNLLVMPPVVDPWEQLDRLDWDKPFAISETSSRSCPVWNWSVDGNGETLLRIPGTPTTQRFWLDRALQATKNQSMEFMVQSLYEDYPPVGREFFQHVDTPLAYNAINLWPCSGLYSENGAPKTEVLPRWREAVR